MKRLALVIRGAVSLGSYEGGVLYELLRALEHHNQRLPAGDARRISIDVLSGASAGSMTAAITSQVLLGGLDRLVDARQNPFYQAWVVDVSLAELLRYRSGEYAGGSLLSGRFITELAEKHLGTPPAGTPHSARPTAGQLRLAFALSGLRGLDYDITREFNFPCTKFQDEWCGAVDPAAPAAADWAGIRAAAITSGAFPGAFPVRFLSRRRNEYNEDFLSPVDWPPSQAVRDLPYVDGGVFNNEPLGLAKSLVDENDQHRDNDSRYYLYVSPSPKLSARAKDLTPPDVPLLDVGGHLMQAMIGQAQYQDLSALLKTNRRIAAFDATARGLAQLLGGGDHAFTTGFLQTAPRLAAAAFANLPEGEETLEQAVQRLVGEYSNETWFQAALSGDATRDAWARLLAAFERTATLQHKDTMTLFTICASEDELLGDPLAHFGGFTCQEVRHHDYEVGRDKTQRWLRDPQNKLRLDLAGYQFEPVNLSADRTRATLALRDCAPGAGQDLGSRVADKVKDLLRHFGIAWPLPNFIASGISKLTARFVEKALETEAGAPPPPVI
ncbi:MAG TPA: patatin-like phospholipase family protein [Lacunisphaera sp.]|jgi:predicted acylesterase/phospholipase RssA|nr:patatin-like phospholipase family protein [Lacunisphaera sp.]